MKAKDALLLKNTITQNPILAKRACFACFACFACCITYFIKSQDIACVCFKICHTLHFSSSGSIHDNISSLSITKIYAIIDFF